MLVIDDSRLKLLKMKEKILEVSEDNRESVLEDYKKIVLEIDKEVYADLIEKIKSKNYNNLPLEEQIEFLNEIEEDYTSLNELQWRYRKTYQKYSSDELNLSDIDNILINEIRERKSAIQGYMMNLKNLENNKLELDRLTTELISEDKKNNLAKSKIISLDEELKNNVLRAKGAYNINGGITYITIDKEFDNLGLDLRELIDNQEVLNNELRKAEKENKDSEETLKATLICYDNLPNDNNKEIYINTEKDTIKTRYKLALLNIVKEICEKTDDYNLARNKRYKILDLIKERANYLKELGIILSIDSFEKIRAEEQLEVINSLGDNANNIDNIKKTIAYFANNIEEMTERNKNLLSEISKDFQILKDDTTFTDDITNKNIPIVNEDTVYGNTESNRVIKVSAPKNNFMFARVREKTDGVINRVNEMFNEQKHETYKEVTPQLVIENVPTILDEPNVDKEIFPNKDNIFEDNSDEIIVDKTDNDDTVVDLFQEVEPFEETPLFNDRYDDEVFGNNNKKMIIDLSTDNKQPKNSMVSKEETMPDAFWITKEEEPEEVNNNNDNVLSFDEQVAALMNNDSVTKTKRRAG